MSIRQAAEKVFPGEFDKRNSEHIKDMKIGDAFKYEGNYHIITKILEGARIAETFNVTERKEDQVCELQEAEKVNVHFI